MPNQFLESGKERMNRIVFVFLSLPSRFLIRSCEKMGLSSFLSPEAWAPLPFAQ
jgi:hypothetical protein